MRSRWTVGLLLMATAALAADPPGLFAPTLPAGVADVSTWEVVSGSFDTPQLRGRYVFYVNPERGAMYQLMRFRTSPPDGSDGGLGSERVAFVVHPGVREPMRCWQRQADPPGWRAVAPGTPEYLAEMATLMRVLAAHRAAAPRR